MRTTLWRVDMRWDAIGSRVIPTTPTTFTSVRIVRHPVVSPAPGRGITRKGAYIVNIWKDLFSHWIIRLEPSAHLCPELCELVGYGVVTTLVRVHHFAVRGKLSGRSGSCSSVVSDDNEGVDVLVTLYDGGCHVGYSDVSMFTFRVSLGHYTSRHITYIYYLPITTKSSVRVATTQLLENAAVHTLCQLPSSLGVTTIP